MVLTRPGWNPPVWSVQYPHPPCSGPRHCRSKTGFQTEYPPDISLLSSSNWPALRHPQNLQSLSPRHTLLWHPWIQYTEHPYSHSWSWYILPALRLNFPPIVYQAGSLWLLFQMHPHFLYNQEGYCQTQWPVYWYYHNLRYNPGNGSCRNAGSVNRCCHCYLPASPSQ